MTIFGLDKKNQNYQDVHDGKIDANYSSLVNLDKGELMFPFHLPFAYDAIPRIDSNENFILAIKLNENTTKILGSGTSNNSGAFKLESTLDLGTGIYTIIAEGSQGSSASAPLLISLDK